ncbi:hypothetical protein GCM10011504_56150 [Siccirubricoccus deserti]|uniref:DUF3489 domain-containing protein n=1 Tax=Siccirubricoccus deserti TaxID=2013562 RepID=A0A9X0R3M6_9PROT|nr:DUF3489 domain-containing protein [Siccirubricoccus deserti]MBC4019281.1 DUF3489 domain-containing protein [Siccirubricoccus deserti]GGC71229.1 hypothetical protein GCM10011504_56150 [Siccirubricoccus deserti]
MSNSLTVAQLLVLATAAQRSNHMVMPLPSTVRVRGGAQRNLLAALLRMELVKEIQVNDAAFAWRTDDAGRHLGLRLTAAGLVAAGVPEGVSPPPADKNGSEEQAPASFSLEPALAGAPAGRPPARRPTGKLGEVLTAISAGAGATLSEITVLTGWLPHTTRAAVTGLRQRGFPIQLIEREGRKAYRLTTTG